MKINLNKSLNGKIMAITQEAYMNILNGYKQSNMSILEDILNMDIADSVVDVTGTTAIVEIHGTLMKGCDDIDKLFGCVDTDEIYNNIKEITDNEVITDVILDINSPGGWNVGVARLAQAVKDLSKKKRCIAYVDTMCCSAAYWVASNATAIYATSDAILGSIGTYILHYENSRQLDNEGITVNPIYAGKFKLIGNSNIKMTDEEKNIIQNNVDKTNNEFVQNVLSNRNISIDDCNGLTFTGEEAIEKNFADFIVSDLQEIYDDEEDATDK